MMEVAQVPIYEYQCTKCGEIFEAFQKITDEPLTQCKFCQSKVEKLISHSSFQLKGSGWYLTDYAHKSSSSSLDTHGSSESSDKKSETKTEAKTEAKVESKAEAKSSTTSA
jgi:putative FmdB family regulatory protein